MVYFPKVAEGFYFTKLGLGLISGVFIQKLLCKLPEMVMTGLSGFTHLGLLLRRLGGSLETTVLTYQVEKGLRDRLDILIGKALPLGCPKLLPGILLQLCDLPQCYLMLVPFPLLL